VAWDERFDYIGGYFIGYRGLLKQGIQDWVPIDSNKLKGDVGSPHSPSSPYESVNSS
jgi:hypothetical protein